MILKAPGDFRIHRLRIIHLYEADFNFILGIKWRQLLHHVDQLKLIHRGQYGGRPGKEATTLTFIEELKTDICYASRKPMINFDNDAALCYDRIIAAIASLIARAHGQHRDVCFVHAETLWQAKFRLKTTMGVSDVFYKHCKAYPILELGKAVAIHQLSGFLSLVYCLRVTKRWLEAPSSNPLTKQSLFGFLWLDWLMTLQGR
jgi:hypothetical protein